MLFDKSYLDQLCSQAEASPRLRVAYDLRTNDKDSSQRMLNALFPGTVIPIHRHPSTTETMIVVRGSVKELFYNGEGELTESFVMTGGSVFQIPAGQFHSLECLEKGTVIFEAKDGAYAPVKPEDVIL